LPCKADTHLVERNESRPDEEKKKKKKRIRIARALLLTTRSKGSDRKLRTHNPK
jgi:hypothetical protein